MEIQNSEIIERLTKLDASSPLLKGHILKDRSASGQNVVRIYPTLDLNRYYEVEEASVVDVLDDSKGSAKKTVVVREGAGVYLTQRTRLDPLDLGGAGSTFTPTRGKLPPYLDRLTYLLALGNSLLLNAYVGTESIPGVDQTGNPGDDL